MEEDDLVDRDIVDEIGEDPEHDVSLAARRETTIPLMVSCNKKGNVLIVVIEGGDDTLGNLYVSTLNKMPDVIDAGYSIERDSDNAFRVSVQLSTRLPVLALDRFLEAADRLETQCRTMIGTYCQLK